MTQKEFEDRTKLSVTADEFDAIDDMYMACGDNIDKDKFCSLYMTKDGRLTLMAEMAKQRKKADEALRVAKNEVRQAEEDMLKFQSGLADWLTEQAEKWAATDLRDKAIQVLGAREYLRRKIKRGYNLWEVDKELLTELLA